MLESGYKISDLPSIPFSGIDGEQKNKIAFDDTYMLGYANTVYGIKYNRNNYKIPLSAIREDIRGYIGIESLVSPWSEQMKLWHGVWNDNASKNRSYVKVWNESEKNHPHYMPQKFADLENSYYIIKNAPFPYETKDCNNRERGEVIPTLNVKGENYNSTNKILSEADPYADSNKIVLKSYVDERLAAKRLIDVKTEFWVRDYDCNYVIRANELKEATKTMALDDKLVIKIHYPKSFEERIKNNNLEFSLLVEGVETAEGSGVYKPAISNLAVWEMYDADGNKLNICWLNKTDKDEIIIPNLHEERLYDNARYIIFKFKTVTDIVENFSKFETINGKEEKVDEYTKAKYSVYAACENMLYRNRAVTTVNDNIVEHLHIISSDKTVTVNDKFNSGTLTVDLSVTDLPTYDIISSGDNVIIDKTVEGNDTTFNISVVKPKEIEILSSKTVKVNEIHSDNTKYYSLDIDGIDIIPNGTGITVERAGNIWEIGTNLTIEAGDNVTVEETIADNNKNWRISAICNADSLQIEGGNNIDVSKEDGIYIISQIEENSNTVILKDLPQEISFKAAKNEIYKTSTVSALSFNFDGLKEGESVTTKLYFKTPASDSKILGNIQWVMTRDNISPVFKANRLYCISFTALPDFINGTGYKVFGKVDWFQIL